MKGIKLKKTREFLFRVAEVKDAFDRCTATVIGRKNETKIIFVVLLQINSDIPNLVSNVQAVFNYKQLP